MTGPRRVEDLLRSFAPQVLGTLTRRYGHFDACEDATQEALVKAVLRWPEDGVPDNPRGWLLTVASRVLIDEFRSDRSRRRREDAVFSATPASELLGRPADTDSTTDRDDSLTLLFLCCHPALSVPSQVALTLRAVGGLTTAQIAAAFLVPKRLWRNGSAARSRPSRRPGSDSSFPRGRRPSGGCAPSSTFST